jgi:hypothetical protein
LICLLFLLIEYGMEKIKQASIKWTTFYNFNTFFKLTILELCKNCGQVKLKFGQVNVFVTCPNGQVG